MATSQYGVVLAPQQEHADEGRGQERLAQQERGREPVPGPAWRTAGATSTMKTTAGRIAAPAWSVSYPCTFCRYCWLMKAMPINEPNTMMPAHGRDPERSARGDLEVVQRVAQRAVDGARTAPAPTAATANRPSASACMPGAVMKLRPMTSAPIITADRTPPRLSTGSVDSLNWAGTCRQAMYSATSASGIVTRNTDPQAKCSSRKPESSGPRAAMPPPMPTTARSSAFGRRRSRVQ